MIRTLLLTILAIVVYVAFIYCMNNFKNWHDKPLERWAYYGKITSLRIDDDAQYHFSTDITAKHDIPQSSVYLDRSSKYQIAALYMQEEMCPDTCSCYGVPDDNSWRLVTYTRYKICLPADHKIETFQD